MTDDHLRPLPDLVEQYEALRTFALGHAVAGPAPRGLALVLRQGLPAWIIAWTGCATASASAPSPRPPADGLPEPMPALQLEVATVLAEMALASLGR
jgi:hypothetical protein